MAKEQSARFLQSYLTAISMRRKAHEMGALFGGRLPHPPAFIVGGFTATPRQERIDSFKAYLAELIPFIRDTYVPNVEELCASYTDYYGIGKGPGNLLAYGVFELSDTGTDKLLPGGFTLAGSDLVEAVDPYSIREQNGYSWYAEETDNLSPISGETEPEYPKGQAYSWLKAPRYNGVPFEVGPLARMTVAGRYANGVSVLDRLRARAYEAELISENLLEWVDQLSPEGPVYSESSIPQAGEGAGMTEAPRGALGHWLRIGNSALSRYQVITPTTWNASPRDSQGVPGPLEQALLGTPVHSADEPIEVLRVIHSMDPCLDCAVHVARPNRGAAVITIPHTHGEGTHHGHSHDGSAEHHHPEPHVDRSHPGGGSE
jgi:hydrogenase large subunit